MLVPSIRSLCLFSSPCRIASDLHEDMSVKWLLPLQVIPPLSRRICPCVLPWDAVFSPSKPAPGNQSVSS
jgi:hypothetical protein